MLISIRPDFIETTQSAVPGTHGWNMRLPWNIAAFDILFGHCYLETRFLLGDDPHSNSPP